MLSTKWGTIKEIKNFVKQYQKSFISKYDTVIEGRDIATRIAPTADVKFYLHSAFEIRVERLWRKNKKISKDMIRENLKTRDYWDINHGNFVKPTDAIEIDTSYLSIDEIYKIMIKIINEKLEDLDRNIQK